MELNVRWLTYREIRDTVEGFLAKAHPSLEIPVPVDLIIERSGVDIIPVPGLQASCDVDALTMSDLSAICVDEGVFRTRETRYRFSLAHELGHIEMHAEFLRDAGWTDIPSWKARIQQVPDQEYGRLEWQANTFAALLLLPDQSLPAEVEACRLTIAEVAPGLERDDPEQHQAFVAECIARRFCVSPQCARIRLSGSIRNSA